MIRAIIAFSLLRRGDQGHVLKCIGYQRPRIRLRHMAFGAEVTARRDVAQYLAVAIHEMRDADHRRAGALGELPPVAIEAAIGLQRQLIVVDRVRDHRRLLRIIAHHPLVIGDRSGERWRGMISHRLCGARYGRHGPGRVLGVDMTGGEDNHAAEQCSEQ